MSEQPLDAAELTSEVRADIRHWRRGRAEKRLRDALMDAYIAIFGVVLYGSVMVNVVISVRRVVASECTASACRSGRDVLPWVAGLAALAACLGIARLFGPLFTSPAVTYWLVRAPLDRATLLRPRLLALGAITLGAAGLSALVAAGLAAFPANPLIALTIAACLAGFGAVSLAAIAQAVAGRSARIVMWVCGTLAWTGLLLLACGWVPDHGLAPGSSRLWWLAPLVVAALALAIAGVAWRTVGRTPLRAIAPGGRLSAGLSGALASLDLALVYDVLLARRWSTHEAVVSRRGGGLGFAALVYTDVVRLRRNPQAVLLLAAGLVVPYAGASVGLERVVLLLVAGTGFVTGLTLCSAMRVVTRAPSLLRSLPFANGVSRRAMAVVPAAALLAFALACIPAIGRATGVDPATAVLLALATGVSALASATRWVTGRPPDYTRPLVSTPAGGVPTNLYGSALRGFDILLISMAPVLIWPSVGGAEGSLAISLVTLAYLLGRE